MTNKVLCILCRTPTEEFETLRSVFHRAHAVGGSESIELSLLEHLIGRVYNGVNVQQ